MIDGLTFSEALKNEEETQMKPFEAKSGENTCNECATYDRCVELEKTGGVPHNGSRACKYFISEKSKQFNLLKKWQKRLYLTDWVVDFRPNSVPSDFVLQDCVGETEWQEVNKTAIIRIVKPDCYGQRIVPFDFEKTLVHELLHLKFCLLGESGNDLQDRYVHQLIDELARALVASEREVQNE